MFLPPLTLPQCSGGERSGEVSCRLEERREKEKKPKSRRTLCVVPSLSSEMSSADFLCTRNSHSPSVHRQASLRRPCENTPTCTERAAQTEKMHYRRGASYQPHTSLNTVCIHLHITRRPEPHVRICIHIYIELLPSHGTAAKRGHGRKVSEKKNSRWRELTQKKQGKRGRRKGKEQKKSIGVEIYLAQRNKNAPTSTVTRFFSFPKTCPPPPCRDDYVPVYIDIEPRIQSRLANLCG